MNLDETVRGKIEDALTEIPVPLLQSSGLASFYLMSEKTQDPGLCLSAASALLRAFARYETQALALPAIVSTSWSGVTWGNANPSVSSEGTVDGHFVVVTEYDEFIDTSALQFDEVARMRKSGFLPLVGRNPGLWDAVCSGQSVVDDYVQKCVFPTPSVPYVTSYTLYSPQRAEEPLSAYRTLNLNKGLVRWEEQMADMYAWLVANHLLRTNDGSSISDITNLGFKRCVEYWKGREQPLWVEEPQKN